MRTIAGHGQSRCVKSGKRSQCKGSYMCLQPQSKDPSFAAILTGYRRTSAIEGWPSEGIDAVAGLPTRERRVK